MQSEPLMPNYRSRQAHNNFCRRATNLKTIDGAG
jgi:hypothetical protein